MAFNEERHDTLEEKFEKIFQFAAENPDFETDFVDSVYEQFERNGDISNKQYTAINKICERWGIND